MKKKILLAIATVAFVFSSCTKESNQNKELIIGSWDCVYSYHNYDGEEIISDGDGEIWTFSDSILTISVEPYYKETANYVLSENTIIIPGITYYIIDKLTESELELSRSDSWGSIVSINKFNRL